MNRRYILVTGANGFIGQALCPALSISGFNVRAALRKIGPKDHLDYDFVEVGDIDHYTDWERALNDVDTVVHLAGRAHIPDNNNSDSLLKYRRVNVLATERLAEMAARHKIRRLIYISSVKVNGEFSNTDSHGKLVYLSETNAPNPQDYYAISKWEAEQVLRQISKDTGLEIVILRPPLIYGPRVKANFLYLLKLIDWGIPMPFANLKNKRSFIYAGNLIDIILKCIYNPAVAGETFLISDGQDISITELIKMIAFAMNKKPRLFSFPRAILKTLCNVINKGDELEKLASSLLIDNSKIKNLLNWVPPFSLEEGIKETVKYYKKAL